MKGAVFVTRLAALGVFGAAVVLGGCGDGEQFFPTTGPGSGGSGATGGSSMQGGAAGTAGSMQGGAAGSTMQGGAAGSTMQGGAAGSSGSMQGGSGGTGGAAGSSMQGGSGGSITGECSAVADCDAKYGVAACGGWACNMGTCELASAGCADADHDGYGTGANCMCAAIDCDDANANIGSTASTSCYTGPMGTINVGTCHGGVTTCNAGVWSPCGGEVIPSGEACNNQDDDCNGLVDDNLGMLSCGLGTCKAMVAACTNGVPGVCKPGIPASNVDDANCNGGVGNAKDDDCDGTVDEDCGCVAVAPNGDDNFGNGSFVLPYKTIQKAIDVAAANANGPKTVCVAGQANCGNATYQSANGATITMANGVSVLGSYNPGITWTRCQNITTTIQPQTPEGVTFPATVVSSTALDGFRVDRFMATTTSAVTVDGAKGAILNNVTIANAPNVTSSYGVNVINGGDATITASRIDAGAGTTESIGVRSVGARVSIQNNCQTIDPNTGRCSAGCFSAGGQQPSIVGRNMGIGTTFGVLLQDSPGSKIETSAICRIQADVGAGVRITGDGTGIQLRANNINAFGGAQQAYGIWMDDCNDAAPWILDNQMITTQGANGQTVVNAIRSIGRCHPVIDSNNQILGGSEGMAHNPIGVYCGVNAAGDPSKCVVLNNTSIRGSGACFPPTSIGVRCDDGGCNRIANNRLITGRGAATDSVGVWLGSTGTTVENNLIRGGCVGNGGGIGTSTGVRMDDAYARLENNRVLGYLAADCNCGAGSAGNPVESYGMRVFIGATGHEVNVHSNDIDAGGPGAGAANSCNGRGIAVALVAGAATGQAGIFRNNIVRAGVCTMGRVSFFEAAAGGDPRILENNDFDPTGAPTALYFDEGANALMMLSQVNGLVDLTVANNISMDPLYTNYPMDFHLLAGSPCINTGTTTGAPAVDMDGVLRDAMPDIGADEH